MSASKVILLVGLASAAALAGILGYRLWTQTNGNPIGRAVGRQFTQTYEIIDPKRTDIPVHFVVGSCSSGIVELVDARKSRLGFECNGNVRVYNQAETFIGMGGMRYRDSGNGRPEYTFRFGSFSTSFDANAGFAARLQ